MKLEQLIEFVLKHFKSFFFGFVSGGIIGILILSYILQIK
jgi:hypothetical protein